jgi:hypothetical protein
MATTFYCGSFVAEKIEKLLTKSAYAFPGRAAG